MHAHARSTDGVRGRERPLDVECSFPFRESLSLFVPNCSLCLE